jgi:maleate cis-trans isomerase
VSDAPANALPCIGILYPGFAAEDDYPLAARLLRSPDSLPVVHTEVPRDAHEEAALRDVGEVERLRIGARELQAYPLAAAMWACTSGSLVFGRDGAEEQVRPVQTLLGVPVSSTSLAFADALAHLAIRRVAVAASYPADVAAMFIRFLAAGGVETVHVGARGIITAVEVAALSPETVTRFVVANDHPDAEAILVPDTAMHTIGVLDELERQAGKPVLTANQVTIWQGLRLAHALTPRTGLGSLFQAPVTSGVG